MVNTYDPKCWTLAEHLLADDDMSKLTRIQVIKRTDSLALAIQHAVEEWRKQEAIDAAEDADRDAEMQQLRGYTDAERERI
jgi:hypothetical protein